MTQRFGKEYKNYLKSIDPRKNVGVWTSHPKNGPVIVIKPPKSP
jgi:hypothetical protein